MPDDQTQSNVQSTNSLQEQKKPTVLKIVVTVIALIALLVASIFGTYYYMNKKLIEQKKAQQEQIDALNKKLSELQSPQSNTTTTTEATKQYTTQYEKLKFSYPASWQLSDQSEVGNSFRSPGGDIIKLLNNNFESSIITGAYRDGSCPFCKVLYSDPITVFGKSVFINYVTLDGGPMVDEVTVATSKDDVFGGIEAKNVKLNLSGETKNSLILLKAMYKNGTSTTLIPKSVTELQTDPNMVAFKKILESMKY